MDISKLQKAIDHGQGEFTLTDIIRLAEEGRMQIMEIPKSDTLIVTEIVKYPRKKRLRLVLIAGKITPEAIGHMESLAKAWGLDGLEGLGRKGWGRALKDYGYFEAYSVIVKDF